MLPSIKSTPGGPRYRECSRVQLVAHRLWRGRVEDVFRSIQGVDKEDDAAAQSLASEGSMVERLWKCFVSLEDARDDGG